MTIPWYERALGTAFGAANRLVPWYRLPFALAVPNLIGLRASLRRYNLTDPQTDWPEAPPLDGLDPDHARTPAGSHNDLSNPAMGMAGTRFGRNVPLDETFGETEPALMRPSPREVSTRLLARDEFVPAETLNMLAAAWLQFMVHDWFSHGPNDKNAPPYEVPLPPGDDWPEEPMTVLRTTRDARTPGDKGAPDAFRNVESHWWDASQIYGSSRERLQELRRDPATGEAVPDGKLHLDAGGHLPIDANGVELAGVNGNWWIGLSIMHTLFVREHNAICDRLRLEYPDKDDEWLFRKARLINTALIAKIHTVEWTPSLLDTPELRFAMRGNWWGVLGERYTEVYGHGGSSELLTGIMGSPTDHHTAPYSITEEFVAVYRMHPLVPDQFEFRARADDRPLRSTSLLEVQGKATHELYRDVRLEDVVYSFGTSHPGALVLHNYPRTLMALPKPSGRTVDVAAIDVLRDRERGVPRYCQFRRLIRMKAPRTFAELTDNAHWARELREVYGDVESVDLLPGMLAETPPPGFAFSDTAFRIFILMASRRLKSDRFFTTHFNEATYTKVGMDWIAENGMRSMLKRHFPALEPQLDAVRNAFFPWPNAQAARIELPGTSVDVIARGVTALGQRRGGRVHAFLVEDEEGLTLIDTLFDEDGHRVLQAIAALGRSPSDLRRIVLTHAHRSHLGGLAVLQAQTGATVHAHVWESDIVAGRRKAQGVGLLPGPPLQTYHLQLGLSLGFGEHRPVPVDSPIQPGDRVGPLEVVDATGHTPGHLAFYLPDRGVLITGDAVSSWPSIDAGWPKFNLNAHAHHATIRRLAALSPHAVGVGHGDPITVRATETLNDLVRIAARRTADGA